MGSLVLNAKLNGANLSTVFVDSSPEAHTLTADGSEISTTQSKWSGSSALGGGVLIDTLGVSLQLPGDCSGGCWYYIQDFTALTSLVFVFLGSDTIVPPNPEKFAVGVDNTGAIGPTSKIVIQVGDTSSPHVFTDTAVGASGVWHYLEWSRAAGVFRVSVDGVMTANPWTNAGTLSNPTTDIGGIAYSSGGVVYFDDSWVVKGEALHVANFTPPIAEFVYPVVDPAPPSPAAQPTKIMHINRLSCAITNTPGLTGGLIVGAAITSPDGGYRTFGATHDGKSCDILVVDGAAWEVRTGCTYTHSTTTLTRGTLEDSSTGAAIPLSSSAIVSVIASAAFGNRIERDGKTAGRRVVFMGDSITAYATHVMGQQASQTAGSFTAGFVTLWCDDATPAGAGTLTYNSGAKTLTWQPFGGVVGAPVDASVSGFLKVPSGVASQALYLVWFGATRNYTSGACTITVQADGFQIWAYANRGFPVSAMAAAGQRFSLAAMPAGVPPGCDGYYGMSGASAEELLGAKPQWSQIVADVAVIQIGTNDFAGSVMPATYAAAMQEVIETLLATGTALVVWTTILPRDTDSTTAMQRKARAAYLMRQYAETKGGRVVVFDLAAVATDPATGDWRAGMSTDGVHPTGSGGVTLGNALGDYLAGIAPALLTMPTSYQDTYDAIENPNGNLLGGVAGMALMQGTTGTAGAGASGSIAAGWTVQRTTGAAMTMVCSKVARTDGVPGFWQQIVLASAATNEAGRLIATNPVSTGIAAGGTYTAETEIRIVSCTGLNMLRIRGDASGVTARDPDGWQGQGTDSLPDTSTARTYWLRWPPGWVAGAGITGLYPVIDFGTAAGGAATLQIGRTRMVRTA